jgi:hypothetical protein
LLLTHRSGGMEALEEISWWTLNTLCKLSRDCDLVTNMTI